MSMGPQDTQYFPNALFLAWVDEELPFQATFLRGASPGEDPALVRELEALSAEELETRCRRNGLSRR